MKRSFWLALVALVAFSQPAWAQQDDVTRLRAELQRQQEIIGQLLKRLDDLEKKQALTATNEELKQEAQTQQEAVESVRESLLSRVNLNGYYNFRLAADESPEPFAFQQHHLGLLLSKQHRKFNFHMELELQNVPHHPEIHGEEEEGEGEEGEHVEGTDVSGEGTGRGRERVDGVRPQPVRERPGRQAALPAVLVAESLSEPDALDRSADLPARAVSTGARRRHGARRRREAVGAVGAGPQLPGLPLEQPVRRQQPDGPARCEVVGRTRAGAAADRRPAEAVRRGRATSTAAGSRS